MALDFLNRGRGMKIKGQRPCFRDDEPFSEEFKGRLAQQRGLVRQTTKNEATLDSCSSWQKIGTAAGLGFDDV